MQTIDAILTRRSIRKYTSKPVDKKLIEELIKCAMCAPSARDKKPWHFIASMDKQKLVNVATLHPHALMAKDASAVILIAADNQLEDCEGFWVQDCSAATQNLLLAAHAKGLGAVWVGLYPRKERMQEFQKLFDLPKTVQPVSLVVLGYPDEIKPSNERFQKERLHFDKW